MNARPTIILHVDAAVPPGVLQRLNLLMRERCGPCSVVQGRNGGFIPADVWTHRTTYHLAGTWPIPPTEVHAHLIAAFGQLTP